MAWSLALTHIGQVNLRKPSAPVTEAAGKYTVPEPDAAPNGDCYLNTSEHFINGLKSKVGSDMTSFGAYNRLDQLACDCGEWHV